MFEPSTHVCEVAFLTLLGALQDFDSQHSFVLHEVDAQVMVRRRCPRGIYALPAEQPVQIAFASQHSESLHEVEAHVIRRRRSPRATYFAPAEQPVQVAFFSQHSSTSHLVD